MTARVDWPASARQVALAEKLLRSHAGGQVIGAEHLLLLPATIGESACGYQLAEVLRHLSIREMSVLIDRLRAEQAVHEQVAQESKTGRESAALSPRTPTQRRSRSLSEEHPS